MRSRSLTNPNWRRKSRSILSLPPNFLETGTTSERTRSFNQKCSQRAHDTSVRLVAVTQEIIKYFFIEFLISLLLSLSDKLKFCVLFK